MKISWIADAGIRAETSQGLILFNHDENTLNESSQKDENTIAIFLNENLKKNQVFFYIEILQDRYASSSLTLLSSFPSKLRAIQIAT